MNMQEGEPSLCKLATTRGTGRQCVALHKGFLGLFLCVASVSFLEPASAQVSHDESKDPVSSVGDDPWKLTFGLGLGSLYSSAGVNVGIRDRESLLALSIGCRTLSDLHDCNESVLLGYYRANLFGSNSGRHAAGLWAGRTGSFARVRADDIDEQPIRPESLTFDPLWGGGLGYLYFHKGIDSPGPVIGLGYQVEKGGSRDWDGRFEFSLGFQF